MPKKGKVNKLARMSDEERARYLQHRADLEEEARRRKQELIARFIKNKLDKEEKFSRTNTAKLNQSWRYILRRIKCKEMATDIQAMMGSFQFVMERKDRLLTSLLRCLDDSDEQHRRAFQAHTEVLSNFLEIGTQRLDHLQIEYERQKNSLLENWDKEYLQQCGNQEKSEYTLRLIMFKQNHDFVDYKKENETFTSTAKNNARLEHEEEMNLLRKPKELEVESYWTRLREVFNDYTELHAPMLARYQELRERDQFYQRNIARNQALIQRASEVVMLLQKEWTKADSTMSSKLKRMQEQKEKLSQRYWQLKKSTKNERTSAGRRLEEMVQVSQDAIAGLEEVKEKLCKILQLADICAKYERDDDKFTTCLFDDVDQTVEYENLNQAMIDECKEFSKMDKFLLKTNRVKVQTLCLRAEKSKLCKENSQLKNYLKRYLTELALTGNEQSRPVSMTTQPRKVKTTQQNLRARPVTCIEGALSNAVLHEKRMKLEKKNREAAGICAYPRFQFWMQTS